VDVHFGNLLQALKAIAAENQLLTDAGRKNPSGKHPSNAGFAPTKNGNVSPTDVKPS
jgi:hypothetical protein